MRPYRARGIDPGYVYNVCMSQSLPKRRSIRLPGFDYSSGRSYFITFCAEDRVHLFGRVIGTDMHRNDFGEIAEEEWLRSFDIRRELIPHAHIVMPNHIHLLFSLDPEAVEVDGVGSAPIARFEPTHREFRRTAHSVGTVIGGFKGAVTSRLRKLVGDERWQPWQRNYYEHIVRDETDFTTIHHYIETNPANWRKDRFFTPESNSAGAVNLPDDR